MEGQGATSHALPPQGGLLRLSEPMSSVTSSIAAAAARLAGLGGRTRLHLSISSGTPRSIPIISETPEATPNALPNNNTSLGESTTSTSAVAEFARFSSSPSSTAPLHLTTPAAADLSEAEEGGSRRHTAQEEGTPDLATEAERLRLTSTALSSIDMRQVARGVESSLPFFFLVSLVFTWMHFLPIALLAYGTHVLHKSNVTMKNQVAQRGGLKRQVLVSNGAVLALVASCIAMGGLRGRYMLLFPFSGPSPAPEFWTMIFTAAMADLVVRLAVASAKSCFVAAAKVDTQARNRFRGSVLSAADYSALAYRTILPISLWVSYFDACGLPWPLSFIAKALYELSKGAYVIEKLSLAWVALTRCLGGQHGTVPTAEEMAGAPRECSICQEELRSPLRLVCGHLYCENCIEEWLAREATCPMCRTTIRRATLPPRGDGATALFPIMF